MEWWKGLSKRVQAVLAAVVAAVVVLAIVLPLALSGGSSNQAGPTSGGSGGTVQSPINDGSGGSGGGSDDGGSGSPGTTTGTINPPAGATGETHLDQLLSILTDTSDAPGAVDTLWDSVFPQISGGQPWTPLKIQTYQNGQPACDESAQQAENNSFYCYSDDTIWADTTWLSQLDAQYGDYAPVIILLHENGHRVAHLSGHDGTVSIQKEEEADCIAGYETQYAEVSGLLQASDVQQGENTLYSIGDNLGSPWFNPGVHGNSQQREAAFLQGFSGNRNNCFTIAQEAFGPVASIGAFKVDLVQNVQSQLVNNGHTSRITYPGTDATVDLTSYGTNNPDVTGDASSDESSIQGDYFNGSQATNEGGVSGFSVSDQRTTKNIPLTSLVASGDSVVAMNYTQVDNQGTRYYGLWVLIEDPDEGALTIDTYSTNQDDPGAYLSLTLQTIDGLEQSNTS
jgi:uncharacterized protein